MTNTLIQKTKDFVQLKLKEAEAGHDWFHVERVWKNARLILEKETADTTIVELAALLHDIADSKFHGGDEELGPQIARSFLHTLQVENEMITHVCNIIKNMSFKAGLGKIDFWSKELAIVQDADRLDAIGAIGIARAFNYGGYKNRSIYDPAIKPKENQSKEEYKNTTAPTINHFYEKLLLLKGKMNTETGKRLAETRHQYMEDFLLQFFNEWEGKK
ncbi:HD domain-containing protein [Olivibacter sp. CPCC 100613]|uniref:HD domain-containing protein n=1 Tax=Olivibacter sp. CPCC 100613 TaxID=3079931 RepID=UPI002FF83B20